MNKSDSERIAAILERKKFKPAKNAKTADLIVINACSVRQRAMDRVFAKVEQFKNKKIILAGCVLPADKKKLEGRVEFWNPNGYFGGIASSRQSKFSAFVPIMTGCNNFCSYCVVPYTRGREKSRSAKEILKEMSDLIKKGYKEIILLGQNVNSFKSGKTDFPKLLKNLNEIPGNFWLSFLTSHPKDMSDELIETIACSKKIVPRVHLPAQSGSDKILKKMNRRYTAVHYKNLIKKIRTAFKKYRPNSPAVKISTDIIVGFPGETKKQFQNTFNFCKKINFSKAYIAQYSPRPGTLAFKMKDDVPRQEKERRWKISF